MSRGRHAFRQRDVQRLVRAATADADAAGLRITALRFNPNGEIEIEKGPEEVGPPSFPLALDDDRVWGRLEFEAQRISRLDHGIVYVVGFADYIKIGWSKSVDRRLCVVQDGVPEVLTVIATFPGSQRDERNLHRHFSAYRLHGEWFRKPPNLIEVIDQYRAKDAS
jgi:hypothetical protein